MAQLSMCGLIVALDAFGPVTDNAGGIAEMARPGRVRPRDHRPARRRREHDEGGHEGLRDRLRRPRRARPLRRVHARPRRGGARTTTFALGDPYVIAGLFIGGMMPFLFAALAMTAVGRVGGEVVRRGAAAVQGDARDHGGHAAARLQPGRRHRRQVGDQEDDAAGADPGRDPDRGRDHQPGDARRPADRHDRHRPLPRDRDDLGRRRLGQREEADRGRRSTAARAPRRTPPRSPATPSATPTRTPPAPRSTR